MDVKIKQTCGRCGRETLIDMDLQEAAKLDEKDSARVEAEKQLPELLNNTLSDVHPDLIIATRGEEGNYSVKTLHGLCVTEGGARKGCKSRVQSLMYDLFMETDPDKPKKVKKTPPKDTDEAEAKDEAKDAAKVSEEKPAVEKPAVEKPAVEKPAVEKPAVEKPAAEKPVAKKGAPKK